MESLRWQILYVLMSNIKYIIQTYNRWKWGFKRSREVKRLSEMRCVNMLGWMRKTKRDCAVGEWMTKVNNEYMNWATYERGEPERASSLGNVTQPRQQRGTERQQRSTEGQQRGTEGQQRGTERGWSHGWTWVRRGNETDTTDPSDRHLWKISV